MTKEDLDLTITLLNEIISSSHQESRIMNMNTKGILLLAVVAILFYGGAGSSAPIEPSMEPTCTADSTIDTFRQFMIEIAKAMKILADAASDTVNYLDEMVGIQSGAAAIAAAWSGYEKWIFPFQLATFLLSLRNYHQLSTERDVVFNGSFKDELARLVVNLVARFPAPVPVPIPVPIPVPVPENADWMKKMIFQMDELLKNQPEARDELEKLATNCVNRAKFSIGNQEARDESTNPQTERGFAGNENNNGNSPDAGANE
jgi:hypothetical protein